jgi:hypothetical protein
MCVLLVVPTDKSYVMTLLDTIGLKSFSIRINWGSYQWSRAWID